jgi:capsular polysaccharide biosynthesis protein
MNEQALDLKRSLQIVRRRWHVVSAIVVLGLAAGGAYAALDPPALTSTALVRIASPQAAYTAHGASTLVVIASSDPVLSLAQPHIQPPVSKQTLQNEFVVTSLTSGILSIRAQGRTAAQAEDTANAVAKAFVEYVTSPKSPGGSTGALVFQPASTATGRPLAVAIAIFGALGLLIAAALGVIGVLAVSRRDRRLWQRDEIADSIGVPVLASVPVGPPADAAGWVNLLTEYEPTAVGAWQLRGALDYMGVGGSGSANVGQSKGISVAVLSLRSDPGALAFGPQLAAFAASQGIRTHLIIGPQQDSNATATLRAASTRMPPVKHLQVTVRDQDNAPEESTAALTILIAVVDEVAPRVADGMRTSMAVLAISAGAATADELARIAFADRGRRVAGIFVADPDSMDHTTGRLPQLARTTARRAPTRLTGIPMETRQWMTETRHS